MYRMSIEWSRIEPEEGVFLDKEAEHYVQILKTLKSRVIKVFVTLIHFTFPLWLDKKGDISEMLKKYLKAMPRIKK